MRKKAHKSKIFKSLTVAALSASFILGTIGQETIVSKANSYSKAEEVLASLTSEQRAALNQLSTNEETGLQLSSDIDLTSSNETTVIVEFKNRPAKVAQLEANAEGKELSDTDASNLVNRDHETFIQDVGQVLTDENNKKVDYKINRSYKHAFNGISMSLPANQIKNLLKSKAVKSVWSNETISIDPPTVDSEQLKADEANVANYTPYDGLDRLHAEGFTGKGIKVGILDTGMDHNHPDLKDAYKGGYDFVDDDSDPMETTYADWKKSGKPEISSGRIYYTEHGTHVAGIIGGRGVADSEYKMVGAAPEADLYAYRVLGAYGSGTTDDIIAGIDRAVNDGMDVINMSLGNSLNDPLYATSIAVNIAVLSGVTTVVAAGNSGDKNYTLGSPGAAALALTVGASSVSFDIFQYAAVQNGANYSLRQLARNYSDDLTQLKGKTFKLVDVGLGRPTDFNGKVFDNQSIALIKRGTIGLVDKIKNAKAKGAVGVLMYNDELNLAEGAIQPFLGESLDAIPSFSVSLNEGTTILAAVKAGKTNITFGDFTKIKTAGGELAAFSSRGPSRVNYDIKPEVTAPGVSIMSTVPFYMNDKTVDGSKTEDYKYAYTRLSGTSMATPYVAGVAALLLQSNNSLDPADIKSILMNTADPLSKAYSVFEIGSGQVDAYEAIHSNVEFQVDDRTSNLNHKNKTKTIRELTGGISFGSYGFDDQDISDVRNVILKNRSEKAKNFNVNVKFQTGLRGSLDAALNNVTLDGPTSVNLEGNSQRVIKFNLSIPKTAQKGTYEGYIVFTNTEDPTENYQIPFGGRVVNEGIDSLSIINPMYSGDTAWPEQAYPSLGFSFELKSHMKTLDLVLQDGTTGEDLGLVGSYNPLLIPENKLLTNSNGFSGAYYPFTGDKKNPVSSQFVIAKTGHYKLKMIGTNNEGKTFSKISDFMYEVGAPTMTSSFDALDQKVIEYNLSQLDSNGQMLYDFNINVKDPEIEEASRLGIPVDQSRNSVVSFYNGPFPYDPIYSDKNGDYKDKILVKKQATPLRVQFYGMDAARNFTADAAAMLRVAFVTDTYPYFYLKPNKQSISTGEIVNYSLRSNNIKNLKTAKITIPVMKDNGDLATIKNVVVSDEVKQYGDAQVSVTTTSDILNTYYTITFNYLGTKALSEDMKLVNFDLQTSNMYSKSSPVNWSDMQMNGTTIDQSNVQTNNVYTFMEVFKVKPTFSRLEGSMQFEGMLNPVTGQRNYALNQQTIGAKVTVTSYDGKTVADATIIDKSGNYNVDGLKADKNPYTLKVDVPGHFTMYKSLPLYYDVRGETIGRRMSYLLSVSKAGDVNKDNVIDVLDAIEMQKNWGKNKSGSDLNFDGVVDKKDMDYIIKNYGLQNPSVSDAPKAKTSNKGVTLDDVLNQLGLK
ncbi:S8 family serine peptidase [Neobacillus sp. WH10]|uniref:S8 family serine peptidase n=1 Tax=Neobacillus sp. WH10 TaxID=3047873 RepID=UPI0024C16CBC|nr:S8 family serine peptidase [Neobacillus sp. WH10]WHY79980.1 S8 family serine peptidase [Neobacillus sp. WH10]